MSHQFLSRGVSADLLRWILARLEMQGGRGRLLAWRWASWWFERHLAIQDRQPVPPPRSQPGFVLGFWRSGTTLLHQLLYERRACTTVLTWQTLSPASFALQKAPQSDVSARRPMDAGVISLLGPQEDEFARLLLGEWSLYRGFLNPGALADLVGELRDDRDAAAPRWRRFIDRIGGESGNPMLLKSPNHVFRLPALVAAWPHARAVWILRDFQQVYRSNREMWRAMIRLHAVTTFDEQLVDPFLTRLALIYAEVLETQLASPAMPTRWIEFTDLISNPDKVERAAGEWLGLTPRQGQPPPGTDAVNRGERSRDDEPDLPADACEAIARVNAAQDALRHAASVSASSS